MTPEIWSSWYAPDVLTFPEVQERLDPLHDALVEAHLGAAKRYREVAGSHPEVIAALNSTERANFLHGQVRSLVGAGVEPISGVNVTNWDVFTIAVGVNLLVRFKFLGNGNPANVKTEQQRLLERQQYKEEAMDVLALAGITQPPTIVTCGYTFDGFDIGRVLIQRDCRGHDRWTYDIYGGLSFTEPLTLPGTVEAVPAVIRSTKKPASEATGVQQG